MLLEDDIKTRLVKCYVIVRVKTNPDQSESENIVQVHDGESQCLLSAVFNELPTALKALDILSNQAWFEPGTKSLRVLRMLREAALREVEVLP